MWMGWKNDGTDVIYPLIDAYEDTYGIKWKFVSETEYQHFFNLKALSDAMTKAQDYGFDITSALNVYNNTASTNEELEAATTDLKTKSVNMKSNMPLTTSPWTCPTCLRTTNSRRTS